MSVLILFLPVVAGSVFTENSSKRVPEVTERSKPIKPYTIFDPCNTDKPGGRTVSCSQIQMMGNYVSGEYDIKPDSKNTRVMCDMETDGGGWTVIQRRDKSEQSEENLFEKTYKEYEEGFGSASTSFWIGNKNLHALTTQPNNKQVLRIELTSTSEGNNITVNYGEFLVGSEKEKYRITVGMYTGPNGYNSLTYSNGNQFVIGKIDDRDAHGDCYSLRSGGWWPNTCSITNLNGRKLKSSDSKTTPGLGITWYKGGNGADSYIYILNQVEMKIRDADFKFCTGKMAFYNR